ncbi:MAG: hypothetical protein V4538_01840 [Bacteroidota bacterium]
MKTEVENKDLITIISHFNNLQREKISLGVKNRVQKISKMILLEHYEPFNNLVLELCKKRNLIANDKGQYEPPEEFYKLSEYLELAQQKCTLTFDPIDWLLIKDIETTHVYDFDLLKAFFENYSI